MTPKDHNGFLIRLGIAVGMFIERFKRMPAKVLLNPKDYQNHHVPHQVEDDSLPKIESSEDVPVGQVTIE